MIYIEAKKDHDSIEIATTGHAYSNEPGKDLVCCAISTLIQTLAYFMQDNDKKGEYIIREGDSYIKGELDQKTAAAAEAILFGIEQIANQYIQYVNFKKV